MTTDPVIKALTDTIEALEVELLQLEQMELGEATEIGKGLAWLRDLGGAPADIAQAPPPVPVALAQPGEAEADTTPLPLPPPPIEPIEDNDDAAALNIPDWLTFSQPSIEPEAALPEDNDDAAALNIPDWLAAMQEIGEPFEMDGVEFSPPPIEAVAEAALPDEAAPVPPIEPVADAALPDDEAEPVPPPIEPVAEAALPDEAEPVPIEAVAEPTPVEGGEEPDLFDDLFGDDEQAALPIAVPNPHQVAVVAPTFPVAPVQVVVGKPNGKDGQKQPGADDDFDAWEALLESGDDEAPLEVV